MINTKNTDMKLIKKLILVIVLITIPMILVMMPMNVSAQGGTGLNIEVSPLSYDFGGVDIGTSESTTIIISNIGDTDLVINDISLGVESCEDFSITSVTDQINDFTTGMSYGFGLLVDPPIPIEGSLFQSFIPTKSYLTAVDILLREGGSFPNEGYTTTINIREGIPSGSVIGTATAFIPGPRLTGSQVTVQFLFSNSIPLNPGQIYYIEWISPAEGAITYLSWMAADFDPVNEPDPYPYGNAYSYAYYPGSGLVEKPLMDFVFTTYSSSLSVVIIPPYSYMEVSIAYSPSHLGSFSAVLEILSDDPIEPFVEVQLSGRSEIVSNWIVNEVTLNGIDDPAEWNDAIPYNIPLYKEWGWPFPQYEATDKVLTIRLKNDGEWLYMLYEIPWEGPESPPEAAGISYHSFSGNPQTDSDSGWVSIGADPLDYYGWDLSTWRNDSQIDVEGMGNYDGEYYRFEFRKRLDSGDGLDWSLSPGDIVGNPASTLDPPYLYVQLWDVDTQSVYQQNIAFQLSTGPVSWWPGDHNPFDIAGENHGEMNYDTTFVPGKVDKAFYFDGVADYVEVPDNPLLKPGMSSFSIDFWMRTMYEDYQILLSKGNGSVGYGGMYRFDIAGNVNSYQIRYILGDGEGHNIATTGTPDLNYGEWHFIALTVNGPKRESTLYVDGVKDYRRSLQGLFSIDPEGPLFFGGLNLGIGDMHGELDEIEYFNRELTELEVQTIYNAGEQGKYKPDKELFLPNPVPITTSINLTHDLNCQNDGLLIVSDGIFIDGSGHKITGNGIGSGIIIEDRQDIEIKNLLIQGFDTGISILGEFIPGDHNITTNYISDNNVGILLSTTDNEVTNNIIARNQLGLNIISSPNYIYRNLLINNVQQIQENGGNTWDWVDQGTHIGNFWSNYWGDDLDGDYIGDTDLPHEDVDYYPLLDPSIPEEYGPLPYADYWMIGRGGSPVSIQAEDPYGRIISVDVNEIGLNAFYIENEYWNLGEDNIMILIAINPEAPVFGIYTYEVTTTEDTTYSLELFSSGVGDIFYEWSVENVPIDVGQSDKISTDIEEAVDPVPGDPPIIVEPGDVVRQDIDAPTVDVYQPGSTVHIIGSSIVVEGIATDDLGVDNATVNGLEVELTSTNNLNDPNEVSFSITVDDLETGENPIIIVVTDIVGNSITVIRTVFRDDANPVIYSITGPLDPLALGSICEMIGFYTDLDVDDTHTAIWDWGDGRPPTVGTVYPIENKVTGSYEYIETGVYVVTLTVEDSSGEVGTAVWSQYMVIYDPSEGFVTGGGWIDSPEGAYPADPSLSGKANFGFVAKYKKGARVPTGNTEFKFRAGDLNFHSDTYQWLIIAGKRASFKGNGTINGEDSYKFILTAVDGDLIGEDNVDKFRLKIWIEDEGTGVETIIYDNQQGTEDDEELGVTTEIDGGSITIHNKPK